MNHYWRKTMTDTTHDSITDEQIAALREEALRARDIDMVDVCDLAIASRRNGTAEAGDTKYLKICARVINDAAAQASQAVP